MQVLQAVLLYMYCTWIGDFIVCGLVGDLVLCASRRFSICHAGTSLTHETRPTLYRTPLFVFIHLLVVVLPCQEFASAACLLKGSPDEDKLARELAWRWRLRSGGWFLRLCRQLDLLVCLDRRSLIVVSA